MLNFLSDQFLTMVVHAIFIVGLLATIAGFFISKIPFLTPHILALRIIAGLILIFGIYFEGALTNELRWRAKVTEYEEKIKQAEQKAKEINDELEAKYNEKIKTITKTKVKIQERIKVVEKIIDVKCPEVAPEAVDILNSAAKNPKPGDKK